MLEKMKLDSSKVEAYEVMGKLTQEDYQQTLVPLLDDARNQSKKIRFLFYFGPQFEGFSAGAGWEDFKLGFRHISTFERAALVTDLNWMRGATNFLGTLMPCPVKSFPNAELEKAKEWVSSGETQLKFHLNSGLKVLHVEVFAPLSSADFEAMGEVVDQYLLNNGGLNGIVIQAQKFPGWENLGSVAAHFQFVKNHHRKVRRVALCIDGLIKDIGPTFAKHFVEANVEGFAFDDLDRAMDWAGKSS